MLGKLRVSSFNVMLLVYLFNFNSERGNSVYLNHNRSWNQLELISNKGKVSSLTKHRKSLIPDIHPPITNQTQQQIEHIEEEVGL